MAAFAELFGAKLVSKSGEVITADAVAGKKNVLVYFSAHWCPPCRGFTPKLAAAYKESGAAGKDTEVIFVSSDRDQAAFDEYYGEMPWLALPHSESETKTKLSEKFAIRGIPSLIVLDGEGNLVTDKGREEFEKYLPAGGVAAGGAPAPAAAAGGASAFADMFGAELVSKSGKVPTAEVVAGKRNVLVYFSAHWCPPCRGFTPQLAQAYKDSAAAGKEVICIFVSSDKDQAAFDEYYGEMPWHAVPFSERAIKDKVSTQFKVEGIPTLVVLDGQGKLVTANGRGEYQKYLAAGGGGGGAAAPAGGGGGKKACCVVS